MKKNLLLKTNSNSVLTQFLKIFNGIIFQNVRSFNLLSKLAQVLSMKIVTRLQHVKATK